MAFEHREGSGSLFPNKKKTSDSHPNATGELMLNGVIWEVAAWTKTDKNGGKWQSLSVKPKDERPARSSAPQEVDDDSTPF